MAKIKKIEMELRLVIPTPKSCTTARSATRLSPPQPGNRKPNALRSGKTQKKSKKIDQAGARSQDLLGIDVNQC
jgi:hypothetical protein